MVSRQEEIAALIAAAAATKAAIWKKVLFAVMVKIAIARLDRLQMPAVPMIAAITITVLVFPQLKVYLGKKN
ncbi:hypothetical protein [Parasitella parasitica]|uniref:Uncharacterized protein n=1 Tax=Parasitella parasitica TaxID=35722 RepID=A0A0B7N785_9FUNG|nr:hypothetical protein [Parasitella parasitica]